jgi:hypothetical protein
LRYPVIWRSTPPRLSPRRMSLDGPRPRHASATPPRTAGIRASRSFASSSPVASPAIASDRAAMSWTVRGMSLPSSATEPIRALFGRAAPRTVSRETASAAASPALQGGNQVLRPAGRPNATDATSPVQEWRRVGAAPRVHPVGAAPTADAARLLAQELARHTVRLARAPDSANRARQPGPLGKVSSEPRGDLEVRRRIARVTGRLGWRCREGRPAVRHRLARPTVGRAVSHWDGDATSRAVPRETSFRTRPTFCTRRRARWARPGPQRGAAGARRRMWWAPAAAAC